MIKQLVLNVDDLGLHRDIGMGVETLWEKGCISTVSVLSTSDILDETLDQLKRIGIPVGVHLILDGDKPVLDTRIIPSITDDYALFLSPEWQDLLHKHHVTLSAF